MYRIIDHAGAHGVEFNIALATKQEVSVVVFFAKEAGVAVVSALDNVQGYAIKVYTGSPGFNC